MLNSLTMTPEHKHWHRIFKGERTENLSLNLKSGVNVICSANGSGKSTILKALEELGMSREPIDGFTVEAIPKEHRVKEKVFFFSVKDLEPKKQIDNIMPHDELAVDKIAHWFDRTGMSHGETTFELLEDVKELAKVAGLIVIDEPELAMDSINIKKLNEALKYMSDNNCQVIVVSHHPMIVLNKEYNVIEMDGTTNYQDDMRAAMKAVLG